MDARDPLLLPEGACHQLGIISYHLDVGMHPLQDSVPVVRVKLVESVRLLPCQSKIILVQTVQGYHVDGPVAIEPLAGECTVADIHVECCLVEMTEND